MTDRKYEKKKKKFFRTLCLFFNSRAKRSRVIVNDGTWDCSLCTYKNPCVAFRCEMCDSRKGTATRYENTKKKRTEIMHTFPFL
jgi:hypothetical protein